MLPSSAGVAPNQDPVEIHGEPTMDQTSHTSFYSFHFSHLHHQTFPPLKQPLHHLSTVPLTISQKCSAFQKASANSWSSVADKGSCGEQATVNSKINRVESISLLTAGSMRFKNVKVRKKVREPRFCFKTLSDVDVLDDGYKWRKYGQKVVKNTQHPRSYYRCTNGACRVKKRVERLAEDPRMVITTYDGRHVHSPSHDEDGQMCASSISQLSASMMW